jgi:hypothetical protein
MVEIAQKNVYFGDLFIFQFPISICAYRI